MLQDQEILLVIDQTGLQLLIEIQVETKMLMREVAILLKETQVNLLEIPETQDEDKYWLVS